MNKIQAIQNFLESPYSGKVSPLAKYFNSKMEVQVNVVKGNIRTGTTQAGYRWRGYTDDSGTVWKNIRIPWRANENPEYNDSPLTFPIEKFEAIGMTGWNWVDKKAEWVGFDFDSIINHKQGLGDNELKEIYGRLRNVPWVTIHSSTSGLGFHIYLFLSDSPEIKTHTEHAALAKALLNKLSALCNFPLTEKVDCCGSILWIWRNNANGFSILKEGSSFNANNIQWQDFLDTPKRRNRGLNAVGDSWDTLYKSTRRILFDQSHVQLIKWLEDNGKVWWWNSDYWLLTCHTVDLKEAYNVLNFKGIFETSSTRSSDYNCFAFPLLGGAWIVRRYSPGCNEYPTWKTDRSGWKYTYLNRIPSVAIAAAECGGVETKGEVYQFRRVRECCATLKTLGVEVVLDEAYRERPATLKELNNNKIQMIFQAYSNDPQISEWHRKTTAKGSTVHWERIFQVALSTSDTFTADHLIRHLTASERGAGWFINCRGRWVGQDKSNVADVLVSHGIKKILISDILGKSVLDAWELVNLPFESEYPGNRSWNKNAAQLRFEPREGVHPTWDKVLKDCGKGFDETLTDSTDWLEEANITTGGEYLLAWIASLFQYPLEPLPYLFFYGPQNSGKSSLHEALSLLMVGGYVRADISLMNTGSFNGELEGGVLCAVEEVNLQKSKNAYEKIKDWVTSKKITIHAKNRTPYDIPNSTHWIQCSNDPNFCPVFPGDTRIVVGYVSPLSTIIPKSVLLSRLEEEAPAFLKTVLEFELPEPVDRLRIPVIETAEKEVRAEVNQPSLEAFINVNCVEINGESIIFSEFVERFLTVLPVQERPQWSNRKVAAALPHGILRGKMGQYNVTCLGNLTWIGMDTTNKPLLIRKKGRLVYE